LYIAHKSNIAVIQTFCKVLRVNNVIQDYCDKYGASHMYLNTYAMTLWLVILLIAWDCNQTCCCT